MIHGTHRILRFSVLALSFLFLAACASRQPGGPIEPGFNMYTPEQDIELGKQAAAEIRKQVDVVDNAALQDYISTLGNVIAKQEQAGPYPYSFTLINNDKINAFALPGGPIFVHTGVLDNARNEGEVAGVLAHEVSHVALRHATNQASKASLIQLPAVLAGTAIGQEGILTQLAQLGIGLGVNGLVLKYSREAESQADALGSRMMAQAGYDPMDMARFFETLADSGGAQGPEFFASHPDPGNRAKAVQAEVAAMPHREYNANTGEFSRMKQLAANLPPPKQQPAQVAGNALAAPQAPSGRMRLFTSDYFTVGYPSQWEVFGSRNSPVLTIAPRQGLVRSRRGGMELGYGAVMSYYRPQGASDLQDATRQLITDLRSMDTDLRPLSDPKPVDVRGNKGLMTHLSGQSPYGGAETNMLLSIERPEGLFYMVMVAPQSSFSQLEPTMQAIAQSIRFR